MAFRPRAMHRTASIAVGVFIIMWAITGALLTLPGLRGSPPWLGPVDFTRAAISPAEAVRAFESTQPQPREIREVGIGNVLGTAVYRIRTPRTTFLINAETGQPFVVDQATAVGIARAAFAGEPGEITTETLDHHTGGYLTGDLPVFRVSLGDRDATVAFISPADGDVYFSDRTQRLRALVAQVHDLSILRTATSSGSARLAAVFTAGVVVLVSTLTGFWLVWPWRKEHEA